MADARFGGGALRVAVGGDSAKIADNSLLNTGGPWSTRTHALWFKLDSVSGRQLIFEEGGSTRGFVLYADNGTLYAGAWDKARDGTDVDTWSGTWLNLGTVTAGEWIHAALVLNAEADPTHLTADAFTAYVNGTSVASGNGMQMSKHGDDFGIGAVMGTTVYHDGSTRGNDAFAGNVDDLAIWNRALSASEVQTLAGQ